VVLFGVEFPTNGPTSGQALSTGLAGATPAAAVEPLREISNTDHRLSKVTSRDSVLELGHHRVDGFAFTRRSGSVVTDVVEEHHRELDRCRTCRRRIVTASVVRVFKKMRNISRASGEDRISSMSTVGPSAR